MTILSGSVVCITGPIELGLALAHRLVDAGASIALGAHDLDALTRAHDDLTRRGADVLAFPCDGRVPEDVRELTGLAARWFGRVDAVVNVSSLASRALLRS